MSTVRRLPGPVAESWDWQRHGACRGRDSGQFFHPDGERGSSRARREQAAKRVCAGCPVRAECAAHALMVQEPYGVWGGLTETERLRLHDRGWTDLVDRRRGRADVRGLERRLRELDPGASGGHLVRDRGGSGGDGLGGWAGATPEQEPASEPASGLTRRASRQRTPAAHATTG